MGVRGEGLIGEWYSSTRGQVYEDHEAMGVAGGVMWGMGWGSRA